MNHRNTRSIKLRKKVRTMCLPLSNHMTRPRQNDSALLFENVSQISAKPPILYTLPAIRMAQCFECFCASLTLAFEKTSVNMMGIPQKGSTITRLHHETGGIPRHLISGLARDKRSQMPRYSGRVRM
jgi:hypothetical protein